MKKDGLFERAGSFIASYGKVFASYAAVIGATYGVLALLVINPDKENSQAIIDSKQREIDQLTKQISGLHNRIVSMDQLIGQYVSNGTVQSDRITLLNDKVKQQSEELSSTKESKITLQYQHEHRVNQLNAVISDMERKRKIDTLWMGEYDQAWIEYGVVRIKAQNYLPDYNYYGSLLFSLEFSDKHIWQMGVNKNEMVYYDYKGKRYHVILLDKQKIEQKRLAEGKQENVYVAGNPIVTYFETIPGEAKQGK